MLKGRIVCLLSLCVSVFVFVDEAYTFMGMDDPSRSTSTIRVG